MRVQFRYLNLNTEYSVTGDFHKEEDMRPCFRNAFEYNRGRMLTEVNNKYRIKIYTNNSANRRNRNNYCFIDINKYLTYLQDILDFEFTIERINDDYSYINLTIKDLGVMHNYILCVVRYCYEYPYNIALHDAIVLYESNKCPGLNIIDCFNITLAHSNVYYSGEQCCMSYHGDTKPMSKKEIRNVLISNKRNNNTCIMLSQYNHSNNGYNNMGSINYNIDDHIENFINKYHNRENLYIETYNRIKKYV